MNTSELLSHSSRYLSSLSGKTLDVISVAKPTSNEAAVNLSKIVSKLSPIVGNLIEFNVVDYLNTDSQISNFGVWERQDPGFPDTVFTGEIKPTPGFEIKAWFPLATEITARFKDSQNHFNDDQTYVVLLAWIPEYVIFGKPKLIDILIVSGKSVAESRDEHYHNPPHYIVLEPEDTSSRTRNLLQTNTNGYVFQKEKGDIEKATKLASDLGLINSTYSTSRTYQENLRKMLRNFDYRLDTNYAKMNRIQNTEINQFKKKVYDTKYKGKTLSQWSRSLKNEEECQSILELE